MSASVEADIVRAKENLRSALGERYLDYMQSMKKWFAGKTTKQQFDREAREIVTDANVHLHNEFLLCIITKCNNFDSVATQAAITQPKTSFPLVSATMASCGNTQRTPPTYKSKNKKGKSGLSDSGSNPNSKPIAYHLRFVPVDPIKHAPSMINSSLETALNMSEQFSLEFCARERSLPYAKMIHGRMLVSAVDHNLQSVDIKAVFLLAEATINILKKIVTKLASRSRFRHELRCKAVSDLYETNTITDAKLLDLHRKRSLNKNCEFEMDVEFMQQLKSSVRDDVDIADVEEMDNNDKEPKCPNVTKNDFVSNNPMNVPVRKLPTNLFDLKSLLQLDKSLMPSHSVYIQNMEKVVCNMWHCPDGE